MEFARDGSTGASQADPAPAIVTADGAQDVTIEYRLRADGPDGAVLATNTAASLSMSWIIPDAARLRPADLILRVRATLVPAETGSHKLTLSAIGHGRLAVDGQRLLEQTVPAAGT